MIGDVRLIMASAVKLISGEVMEIEVGVIAIVLMPMHTESVMPCIVETV